MINKTKGSIVDQISKKITQFYHQTLGLGPKESKCYLIEDMVIVRQKGKLLPIEEQILSFTKNNKNGIELVKNIRKIFHQLTTKKLSKIVEDITDSKVISIHSDISTKTGERIEVFILKENLEEKLKKYSPAVETT